MLQLFSNLMFFKVLILVFGLSLIIIGDQMRRKVLADCACVPIETGLKDVEKMAIGVQTIGFILFILGGIALSYEQFVGNKKVSSKFSF